MNNLITAEKVRDITLHSDLNMLMICICQSAHRGQSSIAYAMYLNDEDRERLETLGYRIRYAKNYKGGISYIISWDIETPKP